MIKMFALVTEDGTAMAETALCEECVRDEQAGACVLAWAQDAEDWSKRFTFLDSTGNELLMCQFCMFDPYNLMDLDLEDKDDGLW